MRVVGLYSNLAVNILTVLLVGFIIFYTGNALGLLGLLLLQPMPMQILADGPMPEDDETRIGFVHHD